LFRLPLPTINGSYSQHQYHKSYISRHSDSVTNGQYQLDNRKAASASMQQLLLMTSN